MFILTAKGDALLNKDPSNLAKKLAGDEIDLSLVVCDFSNYDFKYIFNGFNKEVDEKLYQHLKVACCLMYNRYNFVFNSLDNVDPLVNLKKEKLNNLDAVVKPIVLLINEYEHVISTLKNEKFPFNHSLAFLYSSYAMYYFLKSDIKNSEK